MKYLCIFLICVTAQPAKKQHLKDDYSSPLDNFFHRLDAHNYWLQTQLKSEKSTLNEVANYPNDDESTTFDSMDETEQQMALHYMNLAQKNVKNVLENGKCKIPSRRCVDVQKMRSDTVKYWPPCALVHRCEHDSGCCIAQGHVCSAIDTKPIDVHVYAYELKKHVKESKVRVQHFRFENHTECGCRLAIKTTSLPLGEYKEAKFPPYQHDSCRCPKHFVPSRNHEECVCICRKKTTRVCRRIIKGKRSYHSKGCKGICNPPICEYGDYKSDFSRCPRKSERKRRK